MPLYIDGEPTIEEWECLNEMRNSQAQPKKRRKLARLELRLRPELKERLVAEASLCQMSLNTYLVATITYRRRVKNVILTEEGHYGLVK